MKIVNPSLSVITLNVKELNSPLKCHTVALWIKYNNNFTKQKRIQLYAAYSSSTPYKHTYIYTTIHITSKYLNI